MMIKPVVWTIAGSDSSAGAGIQADLHTFRSLGVHGASIITAITAQNAKRINQIHYVPPVQIAAQLQALQQELPAAAIKIGMLGTLASLACIKTFLAGYHGPVILDPVLASTSERALYAGATQAYVQQLITLFPAIDLLTPNLYEAEILSGKKIRHASDMIAAANILLGFGAKSVLIKGGHRVQDTFSQDYWSSKDESFWLLSPRYQEKNYRGTGCAFASAVAASLAQAYDLKDAVVIAKMYVNQGMRQAEAIHADAAFLKHTVWPETEIDLPWIADQPMGQFPKAFPACAGSALGLYPVVDSSAWLKTLLPLGVKTIQLRIKDKQGQALAAEIKAGITLAKQYEAQLFINDYWEFAIAHGAYGVHLGQEDLKSADIETIRLAGLRLGLSTHCYYEVARAHRYRPSYMACGPIFATTSKIMPFAPQGLDALKRWQRTLRSYPVVAIGGLNQSNLDAVLKTGVSGVALISSITKAKVPSRIAKILLEQVAKYQSGA